MAGTDLVRILRPSPATTRRDDIICIIRRNHPQYKEPVGLFGADCSIPLRGFVFSLGCCVGALVPVKGGSSWRCVIE
jgi:hypothetical protein